MSEPKKFSPVPTPMTSGLATRVAHRVPGWSALMTTMAYAPSTRERALEMALVTSPPVSFRHSAMRLISTSESVSDRKAMPLAESSALISW